MNTCYITGIMNLVSLWEMRKVETIEEFYKRKFDWVPDNIRNEIGHFNVFKSDPFAGVMLNLCLIKAGIYFKIMLVIGNSKVHHTDKVIEVQKQALSFSNPQIPYKWEHTDNIRSGLFCIFNERFFHQYGDIKQYAVFQPNGTHIVELMDEQVSHSIKVDRVVAVIDLGEVVNPDNVKNQVEGAIIMGLSAAVKPGILLKTAK
jgi:AraC family transcriptional regulator, transcriptional activator of pobA